jgi:hypothetical protein
LADLFKKFAFFLFKLLVKQTKFSEKENTTKGEKCILVDSIS